VEKHDALPWLIFRLAASTTLKPKQQAVDKVDPLQLKTGLWASLDEESAGDREDWATLGRRLAERLMTP
jgi:hypothetical protein